MKRIGAGGSDDGASLILVLLFVMVVGIVLGGLLPYTGTGIREAATARDVRSVQNAVDGAMAGAINQVRPSLSQGSSPTAPCPQYTAPTYANPIGGGSVNVTVTCAGTSNSSALKNVPDYAVVTRQGGVNVTGNGVLTVDGGLYSATGVTDTADVVNVVGDVYTTSGACSPLTFEPSGAPKTGVQASGVKHCPVVSGDPAMPTPRYPSAMSAVPSVVDPLGTCTSNTSVVTFKPGYYSEIPTPGPTCASNPSKVWWFSPCNTYPCGATAAPGVYYFDFPDATYANYANVGGVPQSFWNLNKDNITVIGGSLRNGWSASTSAATLDTVALRGKRCDPTATGVQFILGGATAMSTGNGSALELCASATDPTSAAPFSQQRLAFFGLEPPLPGDPAQPSPRGAVPSTPSVPTTTAPLAAPDLPFVNPDGGRDIGDAVPIAGTPNVATGAFTDVEVGGGPATYGIRLTGYTAPTPGALITAAKLRVAHSESDDHLSTKVTVTYASGQKDVCSVDPTGGTTLVEDPIDLLKDCPTKYFQNLTEYRWRELQSVSVTYEVTAGKNVLSTVQLDGIELDLTTVAPAIEPRRCASGVAPPCYVYQNSASASADNTFFLGTVYAPTSAVSVVVHNVTDTIFQRGVVVGSLDVEVSASSKQTDAPFQLPHGANQRTILFTACEVVTQGDPCTAAGAKIRLRALVDYTDYALANGSADVDSAQVFPGRLVTVRKWTALR